MTAKIGIAISGGGHRATVWGWGALLALVDARVNREVVSISSVSGGSIASGVVANAGDYSAMARADIERALRPGLRVAARDGLFFFGPPTNRYVATLFALIGAAVAAVVALLVAAVGTGRGWPLPWFLVLSVVAVAVVAGPVLKLRFGLGWRLLLLGAVGLVGPLTVAFLAITRNQHGWGVLWLAVPLAITGLVLVTAARLFGARSRVVERALGADLLARDGRPTPLAAVDAPVHHVFCTSELQAGDHCYLTPRLVYCYRAGAGQPNDLTLATAVQASACLPGAFVPQELETKRFGMIRPWPIGDGEPSDVPERLVVNDGGVYDNMADHWELGFDRRRYDRLRNLPWMNGETAPAPADTLIVVNAGKALGWSPLRPAAWLTREIRGLSRTIDILYDVSTSQRRVALVDRFAGGGRRRLAGTLVHVTQSPFTVPDAFQRGDDDRATRAKEAITFLEGLDADRDEWRRRATSSAEVPTVLSGLGVDAAADLLQHAYWLTRVNCYVMLGLGGLDEPEAFSRERFVGLCSA